MDITISGRVQGVGFRYATRIIAQQFSICGFVKNISYNKVYVEAEGKDTNLEQFVQWCHHGPDRAKIENISIMEGHYQQFQSFEVRY